MHDNTRTSDRQKVHQQLISNSVNKFPHNRTGDNMQNDNVKTLNKGNSGMQHARTEEAEVKAQNIGEEIDEVDALDNEPESNDIDELDSETEVLDEPVQERLPNLLDLVNVENVTLRIQPKVIFSISFVPDNDIAEKSGRIKSVRVDDTYYSCTSFMRKGEGSHKNPYGALRQPLADFVDYMEDVSNQETLIVGKTADMANQIEGIRTVIEKRAMELLYGKFVNAEGKPVIAITAPQSGNPEDGIDIDAEPQKELLDIRRLYELTTWDNISESESGPEHVISPVFHFNMQFPILYAQSDIDKQTKAVKSMYNTFRNMARDKRHVEFYFGFIISVESLVLGEVRDLFESVMGLDDEDNTSDQASIVVSDDYLETAIQNGADDLGILPHSLKREEIKELVFSHGGSMWTLKAI